MLRKGICIAIMAVSGVVTAEQAAAPSSTAAVQALIRSQHYDEALRASQDHLRVTPTDFRFWTLEGIIFSLQDKREDALAAFAKALRLSPGYEPALRGEVQLLYPAGDQRAVPALRAILRINPNDQTAHEMLGVLERRAAKCVAAREQFALAKEAIDTHQESLEAYGYCLVQNKDWASARPVFEKLAALAPSESYPKYDLAVVNLALKQNQAAVDALAPLLSPEQNDPDVLSLAAEAYEALGDTPRAVSLLRQAIVLSPGTGDYYVRFASLCLDHDSFQAGIGMLSAGILRLPSEADLYLSRGMLYAQLGDYDLAEADFQQAERLNPREGLSSYAADLSEMQRNRPEEALTRVRSQLKEHPDSPLLNLLWAKLVMNQTPDSGSAAFSEAMGAALLAVKGKPDLTDARDLLATMYMASGEFDKAIEQCRLALQTNPSDESATYHLMISLRHRGEKDELPGLVKRLAELHQQSLKTETDRKRYRLVEAPTPQSAP